MALGFGFNKQKVLASAEKAVQQGKLQNAIAEYEKVIKEDPKDLTVLNTIGDLYARLGQKDKATYYFRKVGDIYATEGFTVKAIAVYKKVGKLDPESTECLSKLADLYTQQGLYNDARQQYVQIAEQSMRSGDLEQAARIFQKILELDPENTAMQTRLADLFTKLGRREDARSIFLTAAQSLHQRGALDAADEALKKVISLDPNNADALLLRGKIAADSGDSTSASKYLERLHDLDSRPDALRALLNAKLQARRYDEARPLAQKLVSLHNDPSGIMMMAEALMAAGEFEHALGVYSDHSDRFLSGNSEQLINTLIGSINRVKENAGALAKLRSILKAAGENAHINEITELLAHAYVQEGQLASAGDLYKELSELEPENPLHAQNYKQIQAKLGDSAQRELTPEEGARALMVDELELEMPPLEQNYSPELREAVKAAMTEAELFESYNMPGKATAPLEAALQKAPRDAQMNQRLASLYSRSGRLEEAAKCCEVLQSVYAEAGHAKQSQQYGELAAKYRERRGAAAAVAKVEFDASFMPGDIQAAASPTIRNDATTAAAVTLEQPAASSVAEFELEIVTSDASAAAASAPVAIPEMKVQPATEVPLDTAAAAHEIDLSEWEAMTAVEEAAPPPSPAIPVVPRAQAAPPPPAPAAAAAQVTEALEEVKFYISQSMWKEAEAALANIVAKSPKAAGVAQLRKQVEAGLAAEAAAAMKEASMAEFSVEVSEPEPQIKAPPPAPERPPAKAPKPAAPAAKPAAAAAKPKNALADFVLDLDESLGEDFAFGGKAPASARQKPAIPPRPAPPAAVPAPARAPSGAAAATARAAAFSSPEASSALSDMFAEFKEDVEQTTEGSEAEDPDTHYNLGVAFKEMGLLDEAIGELQKVCHAIDKGHEFTQVMQAYTWLAHCFVEKGVPEASVKWYEKALKVASTDEEAKMAVHYELANAHEAAGNKKAALDNFMEVYGSNIDYRDVAERIKALKA